MTGFLEDQFLRFEGLDDKDIQDLNSILPIVQQLDAVLLAQWPKIQKVLPIAARLISKAIQKQRTLT